MGHFKNTSSSKTQRRHIASKNQSFNIDDSLYSRSADSQLKLHERFRRPVYGHSREPFNDTVGRSRESSPKTRSSSHNNKHKEQQRAMDHSDEEENYTGRGGDSAGSVPSFVLTDELNVSSRWKPNNDLMTMMRQRTSSSERPPSFDKDSDIVSTSDILTGSTVSEFDSTSLDQLELLDLEERGEEQKEDEGHVDIDKGKKGKRKKKKIWQRKKKKKLATKKKKKKKKKK